MNFQQRYEEIKTSYELNAKGLNGRTSPYCIGLLKQLQQLKAEIESEGCGRKFLLIIDCDFYCVTDKKTGKITGREFYRSFVICGNNLSHAICPTCQALIKKIEELIK